MWNNITNIFSRKKTRFKETVKKEKRRFYMFNKKKSSNFKCRRKKNTAYQLKLNFNFDKKFILYILIWWILFSILAITYVLKWWYFSIKTINITIKDKIVDENIAYKSIDSIRNKSIFLENKEDISKKLLDYQKNINNIKINKSLPDTLNIYIDSFPILMNVNYNWRKYSLTSNWVLLPYIKSENKKILLNIIKNKENKYKILSYKKVFKNNVIKKIYSLIKSFKNNILEHNIEKIELFTDERELHITAKNKTIFIFSLEDNIEKQLKKLMVFTKEKDKLLKYIYIDLRIEDKIFICPYEKEYQCLKNYRRIYK